jgi:GxxExxY protein
MNDGDVKKGCDRIGQIPFTIHGYLGSGHSENVHENATVNRLFKAGLNVEPQKAIRGEESADRDGFFPDLLVAGFLVTKLQAIQSVWGEHIARLFGDLRSSRLRHGERIEFGVIKDSHRNFACAQHDPCPFRPDWEVAF